MGHNVKVRRGYARATFGRGQIIRRVVRSTSKSGQAAVYMAGSDPRADGCALGY